MPGFGLVVNERNEILLIQRGYGKEKGKWSLPGGMQDWGENLRTTAVRETLEETGIRMAATDIYYQGRKHNFEIWRGRSIGGHLRVQRRECLDAKWFQADMLPHDENLAFGPDRIAIGKWASENPGSRRVYYPRSRMRRAGFALLVNRNHEVILFQRSRGLRAGKWSLPGGNAKTNERRQEAAIREMLEETGIEFIPDRLFLENRHSARVWLGRTGLQHRETFNVRWFPVEKLPDDDSLGFAIDIRAIEKWASQNAGSRRIRYR